MSETLYQGSKDVFLAGIRAKFDAIEAQALKSTTAIKSYSILGSDPMADSVFTEISEVTDDGVRAVWRHIGLAGIKDLSTRRAGGLFSDVEFIRGFETAVYDPDNQINGKFSVPYEREAKEGKMYKAVLNRASMLIQEVDRTNVKDPFEVFNLAFTAPTSYPTSGTGADRFFARGNKGTDGNFTALGERLASVSHDRADGGANFSNASATGAVLNNDNFWTLKIQGASFVDDVGKPFPAFGGKVTIVTTPTNMKMVKQLQDSEWEIKTAENQINIHQGMFVRAIATPYLNASAYVSGVANTAQWHLVDDSAKDPDVGTGLVCVSFVPLQSNTYNDEDTNSAVYNITQEKVYGFTEPRSVLSSVGDGVTYTN